MPMRPAPPTRCLHLEIHILNFWNYTQWVLFTQSYFRRQFFRSAQGAVHPELVSPTIFQIRPRQCLTAFGPFPAPWQCPQSIYVEHKQYLWKFICDVSVYVWGGGRGRGGWVMWCDIFQDLLYCIITWTTDSSIVSNLLLNWSKIRDLELYSTMNFFFYISIPQNQNCLRLYVKTLYDCFFMYSWRSSDFSGYSILLLFQNWLRDTSPIIILAFLCHYEKKLN